MKTTFSSNSETTVTVTYSPNDVSENKEDIDKFYKGLRNSIDSTPPHNILIILGGMNAKLNTDEVKYSYNRQKKCKLNWLVKNHCTCQYRIPEQSCETMIDT